MSEMCERNVHRFVRTGPQDFSCRVCDIAEAESLQVPTQWRHMCGFVRHPDGIHRCECGNFRGGEAA